NGEHAGLAPACHADRQSDATFRCFLTGRSLSRRRLLDRLAVARRDGGDRQRLFCLLVAPFPPRDLRRLSQTEYLPWTIARVLRSRPVKDRGYRKLMPPTPASTSRMRRHFPRSKLMWSAWTSCSICSTRMAASPFWWSCRRLMRPAKTVSFATCSAE